MGEYIYGGGIILASPCLHARVIHQLSTLLLFIIGKKPCSRILFDGNGREAFVQSLNGEAGTFFSPLPKLEPLQYC